MNQLKSFTRIIPILGIAEIIVGIAYATISLWLWWGLDWKPIVFVIIGFPGMLWILCGALLVSKRENFLIPNRYFLVAVVAFGILHVAIGASVKQHDAIVFNWLGLSFILIGVFFSYPTSRLIGQRQASKA